MLTTGPQLRAARALLGWGQEKLSKSAGVAINTVRRLEATPGTLNANLSTIQKLQAALEFGVIFIEANGGGPGVRLRQRAVRDEEKPTSMKQSNFTLGDDKATLGSGDQKRARKPIRFNPP